MPFAGNTNLPLDAAQSKKNYDFIRKTSGYFLLQKAWTDPKADAYVVKLFEEAPQSKLAVEGKVAIVTGVTVGGAGYYMAEELALSAGMSVIIMGRNSSKMEKAEESILATAKQRGIDPPKMYHIQFDLDDLQTAVSAAEEATKIINDNYGGKLHILINNAGAAMTKHVLTKQGVEANTGRNFLAPHLLTEKLIPLLRNAATSDYKPRCVFVASLAHCLGYDFDPNCLLEAPAEGGAPKGKLTFDKDSGKFTGSVWDMFENYGRAKLGDVATAKYMARKEPSINFTAVHPGSINSNFGSNAMGIAGTISYYLLWAWQFTPSQGARSSLRAALDPDFNTEESLQGAYLHCDGNPWMLENPRAIDPDTGKPYEWGKFDERVVTLANGLIEDLLKK